jgi:RimJ/RimL family protein N-acetyltransferase
MASIDLYIADPHYLGKGIGVAAIKQFLTQQIWPYFENCFVDPDVTNTQAIHVYEKAGFKILKQLNHPSVLWMLQKRQ